MKKRHGRLIITSHLESCGFEEASRASLKNWKIVRTSQFGNENERRNGFMYGSLAVWTEIRGTRFAE